MNPLYSRVPSKINALHASMPSLHEEKPGLSCFHRITGSLNYDRLISSWACRTIKIKGYDVWSNTSFQPEPGDVAIFKVEKLGHYDHLVSSDNLRLSLGKDEFFAGVFGNRYAVDGYEGIVAGSDVLHLLSSSGIVGTLVNKHVDAGYPTVVSLVGYLTNRVGLKINLRDLHFKPQQPGLWAAHLILFAGTGIKTGKTTAATGFVQQLIAQGFRVAMCKMTGSTSQKDRNKIAATRAIDIRDFSDYGFPSTYLCSKSELRLLFDAMLADALKVKPDYIVMELSGGLLQRENRLLLEDTSILRRVDSVVLSASCSISALEGVRRLQLYGHTVAAVSGSLTHSPLSVREFSAQSQVPVGYSKGTENELASLVQRQLIARASS